MEEVADAAWKVIHHILADMGVEIADTMRMMVWHIHLPLPPHHPSVVVEHLGAVGCIHFPEKKGSFHHHHHYHLRLDTGTVVAAGSHSTPFAVGLWVERHIVDENLGQVA